MLVVQTVLVVLAVLDQVTAASTTSKMNWRPLLKYAVVMPLAILWDVTYMIITGLYNAATWIDRRGESFLDKHFR